VRTLLSAGADPGIQNASGENSLDTASTSHMKQIYVDELLRATGNSEYALAHHLYINVFSISSKTRVGRVCQLIAAGLSINSYDSEESRNTPLHWAASYGNRDIVSCLLSKLFLCGIC
jgi:ankyrin repeat protein